MKSKNCKHLYTPDQNIIDIIHDCYIKNFRFINNVTLDYPKAQIHFNLDNNYYTPDDRGILSAANFVILLNQSFLCTLYGIIKNKLSPKLNKLNLDTTNRNLANNVKMRVIEKIKYRDIVKKTDDLTATLTISKIIDKHKTHKLIYFVVDFSVCNGKHTGRFHLILKTIS